MLGDPGRPSWYLRFCLHTAFLENLPTADLDAQPWTRGAAVIRERLTQLLAAADVPEELRDERRTLLIGHITHALADRELAIQHAPKLVRTARNAFLANLLDTAVALAGAPVSARTSDTLTQRRSA